ncbi:MAG: 3',5'-cyclic-nucleotide phosphodiesterase [Proteobacteria bacterium]|nr:3',5'-cyclic-nucleotide phosphodiesterase [Pseudomonadota bacterium]
MQLKILGCNGGIGGINRRTTCYRINDSILIDAGTGLGDLDLDELALIDHVVLTHAHWDHISCLPLLPDAVFSERKKPIKVWALPEVIKILKVNVFNDQVWPDFTKIPIIGGNEPIVDLKPLPEKDSIHIDGVEVSKLPANHGIPACGLRVEKGGKAVAFSGDTADDEVFWKKISADHAIKAVVVECSYPKSLTDLGKMTLHLSTDIISTRLARIPKNIARIIIHRKPGYEGIIDTELREDLGHLDLRFPIPGQEYQF